MTKHSHRRSHSQEQQNLLEDLERTKANYESLTLRANRAFSPPATPRLGPYQSDEEISMPVPQSPRMTHMYDERKGKRRPAELDVEKCSISCTLV